MYVLRNLRNLPVSLTVHNQLYVRRTILFTTMITLRVLELVYFVHRTCNNHSDYNKNLGTIIPILLKLKN